MASYLGTIRSRNVRSTTVVQADGANASGTIVARGPMTSRARTTGGKSHLNAEDAQDPQRLVKVLGQLQDDLAAMTQAQRSNPLSTPFIKRGLSLAPGAQLVVPHTLKRNYTDAHLTNPQNAGNVNVLSDSATLKQYPPDQFVVLHNAASPSASTANFGIVIAGD